MRRIAMMLGVVWLVSGGLAAMGQEALPVTVAELMAHVEKRVPLAYPPIAKAARVSGTVVVQIDVSAAGAVTATKVLSGPPMLLQAALDSVSGWTFKPFEQDGKPVAAEGPVSLVFTLGESTTGSGPQSAPAPGSETTTVEVRAEGMPVDAAEEEISRRYFQRFNECVAAMRAGKHDESTALTCRGAADIAAEFKPDRRFIERRSADVYAATALANTGDFVGGLRYANRAVDVVKLGHDDNSGSGAAYSIRGSVEVMLNNWNAADTDLTVSEEFGRKAIAWAAKEKVTSLGAEYRKALVRDLRVHASVLVHLKRDADAQAKLDEAAKY